MNGNESADESRRGGSERRMTRVILMWVLGVLQAILVPTVIAGVGALWSLQQITATLVVEMTHLRAGLIAQSLRIEKNEAEVKRVSDEQIRRGVRLDGLEKPRR